MAISRKACSVCKKPVEQTVLPLVSGEESSYRVSVKNLPMMQCPGGHRRLLYPDFAMRIMDSVAAAIPVGKRRGLFRKRVTCGQCASDISSDQIQQKEYETSLGLPEMSEAATAVLSAPVLRCPRCGTEQVAGENELMHVFKALARAFKSAEIHVE